MKYISEFSEPALLKDISENIRRNTADIGKKIKIMEVCGTHTMSIGRSGLRSMLPDNIVLLSGPGCPVCVTPAEYITSAIELAGSKDNIIATFGDMIRVPNSAGQSLGSMSSEKIRVVYSPLESLAIAKKHPEKRVIFLGVGFETTAPVVAHTLQTALKEKINNFYCLSAHKLVPPALKALVSGGGNEIDGFILPGHVSVIIGCGSYRDIGIRGVVTGFEPADILNGINMLVSQILEDRNDIENQYRRAVTESGNILMKQAMDEVFVTADTKWRGLGTIPLSGLALSLIYSDFDASKLLSGRILEEEDPASCRCGEVLRGICTPRECPLFGGNCIPENPVGPCMVSSEGACSAYYKYEV
ncbi:MAG: hydrogenase formation protein HypD [Elusimicrobiota bacterium]